MYGTMLEDIAVELTGVSNIICCISELVQPKQSLNEINAPTEPTIEGAFYAVQRQIDRIANRLNEIAKALPQ